ncbi:helix-turn-helix domain-containing protein [Ancylobacter defluvii]|uniref:HTH cro/C1-type domain-containing protein n=1 Tax=Ancylobacter defluvii TaxID=1282440 RepID=A0A9W6K020_9HYPH|nr:helix-turn-helix transcriptional regulator [Ancylobacter defluvii]MBS7587007.1 helix-turn-helix transcriptional regulator [Ancylobacter defluvii]GLK86312.1 hypothetical protein GCM10017653_43820 [Ancylobacter defluvii]
MPQRINRSRLRSERLKRGWSQDQLAAVSGVSVRTVQRLEGGKAATPTSLAALAIAMSLPEAALVLPDGPIHRITPLTITRDIGTARQPYTGLGFTVIETNDPGCIGLRGGTTHLILCSLAFMQGDYTRSPLEALVDRTIPYIWVRSLDATRMAYSNLVEEVVTRNRTKEALVEHQGQWAILAELMP